MEPHTHMLEAAAEAAEAALAAAADGGGPGDVLGVQDADIIF